MPIANTRPASWARRGSWVASATFAALLASACSDAGITSPPAAKPSVDAAVEPSLARIATGALTNGGTDAGTISAPAQVDIWTFTGNAGLPVAIMMGEQSGDANFAPKLELVAPNNTVVQTKTSAVVAQIQVAALPQTGTYTVRASSNLGVGTGNYTLILEKGGAFSTPAGDEGGHLNTNGSQTTGVITVGDLDRFTFSATAGSPIVVTMTETSDNGFNPQIRLASPTGALIGNVTGTTSATVSVTAPSSGLYTVVLGSNDTGNDGTGTYNVNVSGALTYAFNGVWGPITNTGPTGRQVQLTLSMNMGAAPGRPDVNGNAADALVGTQYSLLYDGSLLTYDSNTGLSANLDLVFATSPSTGVTNVAQTSSSALSQTGNVSLVRITFNIPTGASGTVNMTSSFVESLAGVVSAPLDVKGDVKTTIPALVIP